MSADREARELVTRICAEVSDEQLDEARARYLSAKTAADQAHERAERAAEELTAAWDALVSECRAVDAALREPIEPHAGSGAPNPRLIERSK